MKPLVGGLPNMCYHFQLSNLFKRLKTRFRKPQIEKECKNSMKPTECRTCQSCFILLKTIKKRRKTMNLSFKYGEHERYNEDVRNTGVEFFQGFL